MVTAVGLRYTGIANGNLSSLDLDFVIDDGRRLATATQIRVIHAAPSAGDVDIYITSDGEIDATTPTLTNVSYNIEELADTGYLQLNEGSYVVTITQTGTKIVALETDLLTLDAGKIYTAIAVDGDIEGAQPQLILADDFTLDD